MEEKKKWSLKRAIVNTFKWDKSDWKELIWITAILCLAFLYWQETKQARDFINSPCVHKCMVEQYIQDFKSKNPGVIVQCEGDKCEFFGTYSSNESEKEMLKRLNELNISYDRH